MKTKITRSEYLQLIALKTLAVQYNSKIEDICESAKEILEDTEVCGWVSDLIYDDRATLDVLLKANNIKIEKAKK